MVSTFKSNNQEWYKIKIVMADKDINERDVVKRSLPSASVLICFFHTLRTFRREITSEKM